MLASLRAEMNESFQLIRVWRPPNVGHTCGMPETPCHVADSKTCSIKAWPRQEATLGASSLKTSVDCRQTPLTCTPQVTPGDVSHPVFPPICTHKEWL